MLQNSESSNIKTFDFFHNHFQKSNSCVISEKSCKKKCLDLKIKSKKTTIWYEIVFLLFQEKGGLFGEKATVYFYCLQSTTSSSPFSMSKIWFPVQLQCFRKTTAPPKTFYGCMRAANQAKRAKEKGGPCHFQRLFLLILW